MSRMASATRFLAYGQEIAAGLSACSCSACTFSLSPRSTIAPPTCGANAVSAVARASFSAGVPGIRPGSVRMTVRALPGSPSSVGVSSNPFSGPLQMPPTVETLSVYDSVALKPLRPWTRT